MIPRLQEPYGPVSLLMAFVAELRARGFEGDASLTAADRTVFSTDNSIYQVVPSGMLFPRGIADLTRIARTAGDPRFRDLVFAPRGGGTGTNGQSLTDGFVVDMSRHMNSVLEIDPVLRRARVQSGVVKDQLNAALEPHGLFFPPELSTSNRATIGGMISTDACGQGSCLYGKTRDYVRALTTVLLDGTVWTSRPLDDSELELVQRRTDSIGEIHRLVDRIERENRGLIAERFPRLNRSLTGYDLAHIRDGDGRLDLNAILCGSEGTLAFTAEAELAVLPIPRRSALVNIRYDSFDAALRDAHALMAEKPASIETIDSQVLALARQDTDWPTVAPWFPDDPQGPADGINLVEIVADSDEVLGAELDRLARRLRLTGEGCGRRGFTIALDEEPAVAGPGPLADDGDQEAAPMPAPSGPRGHRPVARIWAMRKKAVGLLGATPGAHRPVPFVEDTAVPPEHLADYIAEFRAVLDRRGLRYGMFGHVDAGVLHVRPALDMNDPQALRLVRDVTDEVETLTRRYGGVLWGEHGKGMRSEYVPHVFGPLYGCLREIKAAFDPVNRLNPGKIAAPAAGKLLRIDEVPTRGGRERAIPLATRDGYDNALHCNGNGACYDWDADEAMCPSWKGTRERRHSPKGRAQLLREWLRQLALLDVDPLAESLRLRRGGRVGDWPRRFWNTWRRRQGEVDFSHEVKEAMDGCLACKSCVGRCPVKVDVPSFRARFLELYYGRYLRPARDYVVGAVEHGAPWLAKFPRIANATAASAPGRAMLAAVGLVATPKLSRPTLAKRLRGEPVPLATRAALLSLPQDERERSVVLVQDAFTTHYEADLVADFVDLVRRLGYRPWLAPYRPNGKALHVHGFLGAFERAAAANAAALKELAASGVPLVGLDPSMTLAYRAEYRKALGGEMAAVLLPQEWLAAYWPAERRAPAGGGLKCRLLSHCTQSTNAPAALEAWRSVFEKAGIELTVLRSGCCGMAGTFGHEKEHRALSEHIYRLSWAAQVAQHDDDHILMADGYSCRSQVKLVDGKTLPHPLQALLRSLSSNR